MKSKYSIVCMFLFSLLIQFDSFGQVSKRATPRTLRTDYEHKNARMAPLPVFSIPKISDDTIKARLLKNEKSHGNERSGFIYGFGVSLNVDLLKSSHIENVTDGKIYRYNIDATDAKGLQILFKSFVLPLGGELYVYNKDKSMTLGAFTSENNKDGGNFLLQVIKGSTITIEYFEPKFANHAITQLNIADVIYNFHDVFGAVERDGKFYDQSTSYADISCTPDFIDGGTGWESEGSAVGFIMFYDAFLQVGRAGGTGTLMNNTNKDKTPYFLTAYHVTNNPAPDCIIVQFNYQKKYIGQTSFDADNTNSFSGLNNVIYRYIGDFCLMKFQEEVPKEYNLSYAGWEVDDNRARAYPAEYVGIHHPLGAWKKISKTSNQIYKSGWDQDIEVPDPNPSFGFDHWRVEWDYRGITQTFSSGSPLFNNDHKLIGILHGGASNCVPVYNKDGNLICGPFQPDYYNKLSFFWPDLKPYLSPNSNVTSLDTYTPTFPSTCYDNWQNYGETGFNCGGPCGSCPPTCNDKIQNQGEQGVDCGGPCITRCITCFDGFQNQDETKVDCGGPNCPECPIEETCNDRIQNQKGGNAETGIDCGGICKPCIELCNDGIRNGSEILTDCGGDCTPCPGLIKNGDFQNVSTCLLPQYELFAESKNCNNTGWKSVYGSPRVVTDYGNKKYLALAAETISSTNPNCKISTGDGIYYQLPKNLNPSKQYKLLFKSKKINGYQNDAVVFGHSIENIEVSVTYGLVHSFEPPYRNIWNVFNSSATCQITNDAYIDYKLPTYPFGKQTISDFGESHLGATQSWQFYEYDFTVENPNFNQLFIATGMYSYMSGKGSHGLLIYRGINYFDDFVLMEFDRTSSVPYKYSAQYGPGGGGFVSLGTGGNMLTASCVTGNDMIMTTPRSSNVTGSITMSNIYIGGACRTGATGTVINPNVKCMSYNLTAGYQIDLNADVDIQPGSLFTANIYNCSNFNTRIAEAVTDSPFSRDFKVYPNPNSGLFNIEYLALNSTTYQIAIYNNMGQSVFEQASNIAMNEIDLSYLPTGIYFVKVTENGSDYTSTEKLFIWK